MYVLSRNMKKVGIFLSDFFFCFGCKIFNIFE